MFNEELNLGSDNYLFAMHAVCDEIERRLTALEQSRPVPSGVMTDEERHRQVDNDKLNNCKSNLRICTQSENILNRGITKANTSGFLGVHFDKRYSIYGATLRINGKKIWLGTFNKPEDAARAYDSAKIAAFGNICSTNYPKPEPPKGEK
jgi:thiamine monophosphate synthase